MSATLDSGVVDQAIPYAYERIPFVQPVQNLGAGASAPLFSIQGWNKGTAPDVLIRLGRVAVTRWPGVLLDVTRDRERVQVHTSAWPGAGSVDAGWDAVSRLQASLLGLATMPATAPLLTVAYEALVWRMSVAYKLMRGFALSPGQTRVAAALGLPLQPTLQRGDLPLPLATIVEREYAARQVAPPLAVAQAFPATPTLTTIATVRAAPNELLVLRTLAAEADPNDGVTISVNRDGQANHVLVPAGYQGLAHPHDCFVPATQHLTFQIQATTTTAYHVPVRLTVWRISLSILLRLRLAILTEAGLAHQFGGTPEADAEAARLARQLEGGVY